MWASLTITPLIICILAVHRPLSVQKIIEKLLRHGRHFGGHYCLSVAI